MYRCPSVRLPLRLPVVLLIAVSGGLHIDGLADTADGFFSSRPRERILEIMRDSRTGPMGVAAIVCEVALKIALIASLSGPSRAWVLLLTPVAGRSALLPRVSQRLGPDTHTSEAVAPAGPRAPLDLCARWGVQ